MAYGAERGAPVTGGDISRLIMNTSEPGRDPFTLLARLKKICDWQQDVFDVQPSEQAANNSLVGSPDKMVHRMEVDMPKA